MPTFHADEVTETPRLDKDVPKAATTPPPSIWENIKNRRFSKESPIDTDIKNTITGAVDTLKTAATALGLPTQFTPDPQHRQKQEEAIRKTANSAKEIVKAPLRALAGKAQPGQPQSSAPVGLTQRIPAAVDSFFGGDPGESKTRAQKGDYIGAVSAAVTGPLMMHGLREVLPEKQSNIGPKPAPELRKPFPASEATTWIKEAKERLTHPGQYLPATEDRVAKLAEAIPGSDPRDIKTVLPELDKTIADPKYAVAPKGPVETTSIEKRPAKQVHENETVGALMTNTMKRLQSQWDDGSGGGIYGRFKADQIDLTPVADELQKLQKTGLTNFESGANPNPVGSPPITDPGNYAERLGKLEGQFRGNTVTLSDIDDLRQFYFSLDDASAKGRIALRSQAEKAGDQAIEAALRKIEYDHLENRLRQAGEDPAQVRHIKEIQRKLYSIGDVNTKTSAGYLTQDALERGYGFAKKHDITAAVHPQTMMPAVAVHSMAPGAKPGTPKKAQTEIRKAFATKGETVNTPEKIAQTTGKAALAAAPVAITGRIPNREGQQQKRQPPPGATVKMRAPDGSTHDVAASDVEHYKSKGAQVVQ